MSAPARVKGLRLDILVFTHEPVNGDLPIVELLVKLVLFDPRVEQRHFVCPKELDEQREDVPVPVYEHPAIVDGERVPAGEHRRQHGVRHRHECGPRRRQLMCPSYVKVDDVRLLSEQLFCFPPILIPRALFHLEFIFLLL